VNRALFSSASAEWSTPQDLFDALAGEFQFALDAAATAENRKCTWYFDRAVDGLSQDWASFVQGHVPEGAVWCNPPYGRTIGQWVAKAAETARAGTRVVCLLPSRTDTRWWHDFIWDAERHAPRPGVEVRLLRGRLRFGGAKSGAPFPSAVVVFGQIPDHKR
jgi:phage N-6-adenine-methyltransferase